jgi:hypothetical protein
MDYIKDQNLSKFIFYMYLRGKMPVKKSTKQVVKKVTSVATSTKKSTPTKVAPAKVAAKKMESVKVSGKVAGANTMAKVSSMTQKIDPRKLMKPLILLLILALVYLIKDEVIVASVNGSPVTRFALIRDLEKQSASTVLENITLKMLVEQELKKAKVEVTNEEMDAEIAKIEEQLSAQGQNLDDLLKAQGLSRNEVKEQLALSKGLEKLLADKIVVTEDEVKAYFDANQEAIGGASFEEVKADIESQLKQQKLVTEQQNWFAEIKKNAKINYYKFAPSINI